MNSPEIRKQLVKHLMGGEAFLPIDKILDLVPFEKLGQRPKDLPYSFFEIFYHIRYAQKDILDYCIAETYKTPDWPDAYWPDSPRPDNEAAWEELKESYFQDRKLLAAFIMKEENELLKPVKHGQDQSLLREVMLVIEHTAYHTGQLLIVSRLLGAYSA